MGMLISVTPKPSAKHGVVRFETNRALTGMGHERYRSMSDILGTRPPDLVASALFSLGTASSIHVHGNQILVELAPGASPDGMADAISDVFIHYKPGVLPSIP